MGIRHSVGWLLRKAFPKLMALRDLKLKHKSELENAKIFKNYSEIDWLNRLTKQYEGSTDRKLDLSNPTRFTEKLQWRKMYDINPIYAELSDKYKVREWVKQKIGEEYLIPLLGVYDSIDEVDFKTLPDQFVIKTNNACGTNTIVTDKSKIDKKTIRENYDFWMKRTYGYFGVERHYDLIMPKIIIEKYMQPDAGASDLRDYKFYCFNGKPLYCQVISNRSTNETIDFYDMDWNLMPFVGLNPICGNAICGNAIPPSFEKMKTIVTLLSQGISYVRVDIYEINGKVYFGEMTFTPGGGYGCFTPDDWDYKLGELWDITNKQVDPHLIYGYKDKNNG